MGKQQQRRGAVIFSKTDRFGNPVVLHGLQWVHIKSRHPEMSSYLQQIKETVETPDGWTTSQTDESVACYQGIGIGPERSDLRVLVEYTTRDFESGSDNGMVETAYPPAPGTRSKIHHMKYLKGSV